MAEKKIGQAWQFVFEKLMHPATNQIYDYRTSEAPDGAWRHLASPAEVAASIPAKYLMVETDAPYLAPHPHRGKRNDSSLMTHTVEMLAALHGVTYDEMALLTAQNAARLFDISL